MEPEAAIIDIDGTLVDSNYHHAIAWQRAFKRCGITVPAWIVHRHIGMGGDKLVAAVAGERGEDEVGEQVREAEHEEYQGLIDEVVAFDGARELLRVLKDAGLTLVLASSAKADEVEHYLDLLDVRELADNWTTSADVDATKPDAELIEAALEQAGTRRAFMLGDTPWDIEAARRSGLRTIALLTGGFGREELEGAGAVSVFASPEELCSELESGDGTDIAGLLRGSS